MSMFRKNHRLTTTAFNEVFKAGKRFHSSYFQLVYQPGETFRGAVVVGKKVYKSAVKRNQLRRQLYSRVYNYTQTTSLTGSVILITKPTITTASKTELQTDLDTLLNNLV